MLGFVKARKWVDFVDKNLSQQTKNWDRFIDPPYSRAEHNFKYTERHTHRQTHNTHTHNHTDTHIKESERESERKQYIAPSTLPVFSPNISVLVVLCVPCTVDRAKCLQTHIHTIAREREKKITYWIMLLYEWTLRTCDTNFTEYIR